jgi:hypothetical protein
MVNFEDASAKVPENRTFARSWRAAPGESRQVIRNVSPKNFNPCVSRLSSRKLLRAVWHPIRYCLFLQQEIAARDPFGGCDMIAIHEPRQGRRARPVLRLVRASILDPCLRVEPWIDKCCAANCLVLHLNNQPVGLLAGTSLDHASLNQILFQMRCRYPRQTWKAAVA